MLRSNHDSHFTPEKYVYYWMVQRKEAAHQRPHEGVTVPELREADFL